MATVVSAQEPTEGRALNKGLKKNAIGYAASVVIGVASSTALGYSLAAVLGLIVALPGIGVHAPGVLVLSFLPMLLVALAYKYLNKADPDAGTTFAWATRAFGPKTGWMGGWAIIVADVIVMANLAEIAGRYRFLLFGVNNPPLPAVTAIGVVPVPPARAPRRRLRARRRRDQLALGPDGGRGRVEPADHQADHRRGRAPSPPRGVYKLDNAGRISFARWANDWHGLIDESDAFFLQILAPGDYRYRGADLGVLVTRGRLQTDDEQLTDRCRRWIDGLNRQFAGSPTVVRDALPGVK